MNDDANIGHPPPAPSLTAGDDEEREDRRLVSPELVLVDPELAAWARAQLVVYTDAATRVQAEQRAAPREQRTVFAGIERAAGASPDALADATSRVEGRRVERRVARPVRERQIMRKASRSWSAIPGSSTTFGSAVKLPEPLSKRAEPGSRRRDEFMRRSRLALVVAAALLTAIALMPRSASDRPILTTDVRAQNFTASLAEGKATSVPQTFAWSAVDAARGYEVILYRGARKILVARTLEPRLTLARRWIYRARSFTLSPGSYRWYVWPLGLERSVRGARKPIVEAKFVVVER